MQGTGVRTCHAEARCGTGGCLYPLCNDMMLLRQKGDQMQNVRILGENLTDGAALKEAAGGTYLLRLSEKGAGFCMPQLLTCKERFLSFRAQVLEEHSLALNLLVYVRGEEAPAFTVRMGLLPGVETNVLLDLDWMDAHELFPKSLPGMLKIVCHGRRVSREEISKIVLASMPAFHEVRLKLWDLRLTEQAPEQPELPDRKLIDRFGQSKWKDWPGKTKEEAELKKALARLRDAAKREGKGGWPGQRLSLRGLVRLRRLERKAAHGGHRLLFQEEGKRKMVADGSAGLCVFQHGTGLRAAR